MPFLAVVDTNANNQFVSADELAKRFADAGALTSERVITYCGGGIAASQTAYLLTLLGKDNVALYNGSMTEWGADPPAACDRRGTLGADLELSPRVDCRGEGLRPAGHEPAFPPSSTRPKRVSASN